MVIDRHLLKRSLTLAIRAGQPATFLPEEARELFEIMQELERMRSDYQHLKDEIIRAGQMCSCCGDYGEDLQGPTVNFHGDMLCQGCYAEEMDQAKRDAADGTITIWFR